MAVTGQKTGAFNGSTASCASLIVEWSYTQDINKNTTALTVALKVQRNKTGTTTHKSSTPYTLTVDGAKKSGAYDFDITDITVGSSKTIKTINKTLAHNTDGSYKAVSIYASFDVSGTTLGSGTVNTSLYVNAIPRATMPTVSTTSAYMGDTVTFTFNRASNSFTHDLIYSFEDGATETIGLNIATSKTWTVPNLATQIPNTSAGTCTVTCITYNGADLVGTKSLAMTLKVPEDIKPSVSLSVTDAATDVASKTGVFLKGLSKFKIKATAEGAEGSTVVAYLIKANGNTYNTNEATTDLLTTSGDTSVTVSVTDSRGRIAYAQTVVKVYDYKPPYINGFIVSRTTGSNVSISLNCGITDVNNNKPTYLLEYRKKGADGFNSKNLGYTDKIISQTITLSDISPDYQYNFRLTVSDLFNSMVSSYDIGTEFTLVDYNASGKGLAIGKVSEESDKLEINIPLKFNGNVLADLIYPVGAIYMSTVNTNPGTFLGGTWVAWGAGRVPVGVDTSATDFNSADNYDGTDADAAMYTGGGQAHNDMPPYITCYMFKRTG